MHESSLARGLLDAVLAALPGPGLRVERVSGWIAETEALSLVALQTWFDGLARGTPAEGARLDLTLTHLSARCLACGAEYKPEHHLTLCPACGATEGEILGEEGLGLTRLWLADPPG